MNTPPIGPAGALRIAYVLNGDSHGLCPLKSGHP